MYSVLHFPVDARDQSQTISIWYWCNVNSNKHPLWPRCGEENLRKHSLVELWIKRAKAEDAVGCCSYEPIRSQWLTKMLSTAHSSILAFSCSSGCWCHLLWWRHFWRLVINEADHVVFQCAHLLMAAQRHKAHLKQLSNTEFAALKSPPQSPHLNPLQGCGRVGDLHQGCANGKSIATAATVSMDQNLQHLVWKHAELCWN